MNRIVIMMEGGLIQHIIADEEVRILIVDQDIEGCAFDEIAHIPELEVADNPSGEYYLHGYVPDLYSRDTIDAVFEADRKRFEE